MTRTVPENPGFLDYRVPVASERPMIDTIMVEVPNPRHPLAPVASARCRSCRDMVANATFAAPGRACGSPMSPPKPRAASIKRAVRRAAAEYYCFVIARSEATKHLPN
jgi:hypothetical protein